MALSNDKRLLGIFHDASLRLSERDSVIKEKVTKKEQAPSQLIELIARHINNDLINLSSFTKQSVDYFFSLPIPIHRKNDVLTILSDSSLVENNLVTSMTVLMKQNTLCFNKILFVSLIVLILLLNKRNYF